MDTFINFIFTISFLIAKDYSLAISVLFCYLLINNSLKIHNEVNYCYVSFE